MSKAIPQSASFDVVIKDGTAIVKRAFVFKGAEINFDITVPVKDELDSVTVAELHRRSVWMAIDLLQGLVPPKK